MSVLSTAMFAMSIIANVNVADDTGRQVRLPSVSQSAVIVLDYRGGFGLPRKSDEPFLAIRADGKVSVDSDGSGSKKVESKLSPDEIAELLRFIVRENNFFALDAKAIGAKVSERNVGRVMDLGTVVVRVRTDGKERELSYYASEFFADKCPDIKQLQQFAAIVRRTRLIGMTIRAGGKEAIESALLRVNSELEQRLVGVPPLMMEEFGSARIDALDGTTHLSFYRRGPKGADGRETFVEAGIQRSVEGELKVLRLNSTLK